MAHLTNENIGMIGTTDTGGTADCCRTSTTKKITVCSSEAYREHVDFYCMFQRANNFAVWVRMKTAYFDAVGFQ